MATEKRERLSAYLHPDNKQKLVKAARGLRKPMGVVLDDLIAQYLRDYMETYRP